MFIFRYLSLQLLSLTAFFILITHIIVIIPLINDYRLNWLNRRMTEIQSFVFTMKEENITPRADSLIGVYEIREHDGNEVLFSRQMQESIPDIDASIMLSESMLLFLMKDTFISFFYAGERTLEVKVPFQDSILHVIIDEKPLFESLMVFTRQLLIGIVFSLLIGAGIAYLMLNRFFIRPILNIKNSLVAFHNNPEDQKTIITPDERRVDELGEVERELSHMQSNLYIALRQKNRLATLGTAVAKINHDLSNILQTGVLMSERLMMITDPEVVRVAPKLIHALDRGIELCEQILSYTKEGVLPLHRTYFSLSVLVDEAESYVRISEKRRHFRKDEVTWKNEVAFDIIVHCDRDQITRVLMNLGRNAIQAGAKEILITSRLTEDRLQIIFADNGPGLSAKKKEKLFQPFSEGIRLSGTGLGLAIAYEIMRTHKGNLCFLEQDLPASMNTAFLIEFPKDVVVDKIPSI